MSTLENKITYNKNKIHIKTHINPVRSPNFFCSSWLVPTSWYCSHPSCQLSYHHSCHLEHQCTKRHHIHGCFRSHLLQSNIKNSLPFYASSNSFLYSQFPSSIPNLTLLCLSMVFSSFLLVFFYFMVVSNTFSSF